MMYIPYPGTNDLYVLHRYSEGGAQGEESFLEEIITTGDNYEALLRQGEEMFPIVNRSGWRWDSYMIVVNTTTEEGKRIHEEQLAIWKDQWEDVDNHPEKYEGWVVAGDRRNGGPVAMKMTHNPALDEPQSIGGMSKTSYQYIVWDITEDKEQ